MRNLSRLQDPIVSIDGPIEGVTVGSIIAAMIYRGASPDPIHAIELAKQIRYSKNGLALEDADFKLVEACVMNDTTHANFAKAQAIEVIRNADVVELEPNRAERRKK